MSYPDREECSDHVVVRIPNYPIEVYWWSVPEHAKRNEPSWAELMKSVFEIDAVSANEAIRTRKANKPESFKCRRCSGKTEHSTWCPTTATPI